MYTRLFYLSVLFMYSKRQFSFQFFFANLILPSKILQVNLQNHILIVTLIPGIAL